MKILILTHYFWPENFKINELAEFLNKKNKITVLTGFPSYPNKELFNKTVKSKLYKYKNIEIIRVPIFKRKKNRFSIFLNYLSFLISLSTVGIVKLLNRKFDLILVFGTSPPSVMIPAIILSKIKKIKIAFWVLDLWPETLISMNIIKNKLILKIIEYYTSFIYNFSSLIFAQSKAFIRKIKNKCNNKKKIKYLPTWADDQLIGEIDRNNSKLFKKYFFYITFTGNIGEAQDFDNILNAAELIKNNDKIKWLIVGDGSKLEWLKKQIKKKELFDNFILTGHISKKQIPQILNKSDCLLVTLKKGGIDEFTVPGKLSNYMVSKKPILGMINGETLDIIKNLVAKIDIRRAQVLVEAIIVELSETAAKSLGVETFFKGDSDSDIPIGLTRFADGGPDLLAITGALATLYFTGITLNVYSQIGLVMLIGLVAKNAILIVEFANQLREEGKSIRDAVKESAAARLRPILMTTIATVFGAMPLALATGAGAESRSSIGWVIVGGVTFSTVLSLFVVPTLYSLLARFTKPSSHISDKLRELEDKYKKIKIQTAK